MNGLALMALHAARLSLTISNSGLIGLLIAESVKVAATSHGAPCPITLPPGGEWMGSVNPHSINSMSSSSWRTEYMPAWLESGSTSSASANKAAYNAV